MQDIFKKLLETIGEDIAREGLVDTPERMAKAWKFWTSGYDKDPAEVMKTFSSLNSEEMIIVKNIDYYSMCEHHLVPFYGQVHIGYAPKKKILGVSKFARLVEIYARRLQIQERLTNQIADDIMKYLNPWGVGVIVSGVHLCMRSRGIQKQNSVMTSSAMRGNFLKNQHTRHEFISLVTNQEKYSQT